MTDEDRLRRALDYEIEPWTPDPAVLIRAGRRLAWARRGAAAGAALAVAVTVTGVAVAVNGVTASQPPLSDRPSPSIAKPTVAPSPTPHCRYYTVKPRPSAVVPMAPPTRVARPPRATSTPAKPSRVVKVPPAIRAIPRCAIVYVRPTTPVPTSVPAGQ
jgi:hypothetical protein